MVQSSRNSETSQIRPPSSILLSAKHLSPHDILISYEHSMVFLSQQSKVPKSILSSSQNIGQYCHSYSLWPVPISVLVRVSILWLKKKKLDHNKLGKRVYFILQLAVHHSESQGRHLQIKTDEEDIGQGGILPTGLFGMFFLIIIFLFFFACILTSHKTSCPVQNHPQQFATSISQSIPLAIKQKAFSQLQYPVPRYCQLISS